MRRLLLIALMTGLPAHAGEVYKCKGPKGEITFTNIKCPEHANAEHYATYEPEPEPPPAPAVPPETPPPPTPASAPSLPVAQPAQAPAQSPAQAVAAPAVPQIVQQPAPPATSQVIQQPVQPAAQAVVQEPVPPAQPATDALPTGGSGYKCSDGEEVWMQSTPCPPVAAHSTPKAVERPADDARLVSPVAANPKAPLDEPQVSLCGQLTAQANTPEHQKSGVGADELDKLLAANNCKH